MQFHDRLQTSQETLRADQTADYTPTEGPKYKILRFQT